MAKAKKQKTDFYQVVTDSIIESLEKGVKPWVCPWDRTNNFSGALPKNFKTNASYSGINILLLWSAIAENDFSSPYFLTYKQAAEMGGNVIKGSKGTTAIFYKMIDVKDKITDEEKMLPMLKTFTVFNLDQIDGIEAPKEQIKTDIKEEKTFIIDQEIEATLNLIYQENNIDFHEGGNDAFYSPTYDAITLPNKDKFKTYDDWVATQMHELIHSTGHKKRCDRDLKNKFGSKDYTFEELIAELGAAFCSADFGINGNVQHECYIASWLEKLNNDKRFIFKAASKATQAHQFLFNSIIGKTEQQAA